MINNSERILIALVAMICIPIIFGIYTIGVAIYFSDAIKKLCDKKEEEM